MSKAKSIINETMQVGGVTLRINLKRDDRANIIDNVEAFKGARQLPLASELPSYQPVLDLAARIEAQGESADAALNHAVSIGKRWLGDETSNCLIAAGIVQLFSASFVKKNDGRYVIEGVSVPDSYFEERKAENVRRVNMFLLPHAPRPRWHPLEQCFAPLDYLSLKHKNFNSLLEPHLNAAIELLNSEEDADGENATPPATN